MLFKLFKIISRKFFVLIQHVCEVDTSSFGTANFDKSSIGTRNNSIVSDKFYK